MHIPVVDDAVGAGLLAFNSPSVVRWSCNGVVPALTDYCDGLAESRHPGDECSPIPRVVWTYWQGTPVPLIADACLKSWRRYLPRYQVRLLGPNCLPAGLPPAPHGFALWPSQVQSGWVRLAVLATFWGHLDGCDHAIVGVMRANSLSGGTLCTPLSFVEDLFAFDQPDLIGYYNMERTHDAAYPMLENWFIAAPARSVFMMRWWQTFDAMLLPDGRSDISRVISGITVSDLLQGFNVEPDYFACHAAAQWVMRQHGGGSH